MHCTNVRLGRCHLRAPVFKENTEVAGNLALLLGPTEGDETLWAPLSPCSRLLAQARTSQFLSSRGRKLCNGIWLMLCTHSHPRARPRERLTREGQWLPAFQGALLTTCQGYKRLLAQLPRHGWLLSSGIPRVLVKGLPLALVQGGALLTQPTLWEALAPQTDDGCSLFRQFLGLVPG